MIIHHRVVNGQFVAGIVIEFKKNEKEATNPCGRKKKEHLMEQQKVMERYKEEFYWGDFCWTFEQAKSLIDKLLRYDKKEARGKKTAVLI